MLREGVVADEEEEEDVGDDDGDDDTDDPLDRVDDVGDGPTLTFLLPSLLLLSLPWSILSLLLLLLLPSRLTLSRSGL